MFHLTLFFTRSVSLQTWANNGSLKREIALSLRLQQEKGVKIENDVWLGSGVRILDGVTTGRGTVVTKDVPEFAVVGGVPTRVIKWRKKRSDAS